MDRVTFDNVARRAAGFLDRRSLFAGLSAAALAVAGLPIEAGAKGKHKHHHKHGNHGKSDACKKRVKQCREEVRTGCEASDIPNCESLIKGCCKKACQSFDKTQACIDDHLPGQ